MCALIHSVLSTGPKVIATLIHTRVHVLTVFGTGVETSLDLVEDRKHRIIKK